MLNQCMLMDMCNLMVQSNRKFIPTKTAVKFNNSLTQLPPLKQPLGQIAKDQRNEIYFDTNPNLRYWQ